MQKNLLILGGTSDGVALARALSGAEEGWSVVSSLAGRVANPRLPPGETRIGGFGGGEGLSKYIRQQSIAAMIDATHPFARRMGWNAAEAAATTGVPLLRLSRPGWQQQPGDRWSEIDDWSEAVSILRTKYRRVFLALGRQELAPFTALRETAFIIRSVEPPDPSLTFSQAEMILARGPFRLEEERALLKSRGVDCVVCKNSGGGATEGKLIAARELGIDVIMLRRPPRPDVPQVEEVAAAMSWLRGLSPA